MSRCPHCGAWFGAASAWSGPEPDCEPGILCPACGEFVSDEELAEELEAAEQEAAAELAALEAAELMDPAARPAAPSPE